ncbi:hypothetical protein SUGI_0621110 [Cryptomeria japonica]|nr:hypothetical protein SUGI_0621110 [Cryptomeria japonica]
MRYEEKIADYLQRIDETTNTIRGLREEVKDEVVVKKVIISLACKYDTKVSAIEEAKDLKTFTMDDLYGSLTAYEMRTVSIEAVKKEAAFNTSRKGSENKILLKMESMKILMTSWLTLLEDSRGVPTNTKASCP